MTPLSSCLTQVARSNTIYESIALARRAIERERNPGTVIDWLLCSNLTTATDKDKVLLIHYRNRVTSLCIKNFLNGDLYNTASDADRFAIETLFNKAKKGLKLALQLAISALTPHDLEAEEASYTAFFLRDEIIYNYGSEPERLHAFFWGPRLRPSFEIINSAIDNLEGILFDPSPIGSQLRYSIIETQASRIQWQLVCFYFSHAEQ